MKKITRIKEKLTSFMNPGTMSQKNEFETNKEIEELFDREHSIVDPIDKMKGWISTNITGKTFADVGGIGVNSINERITLASRSGASSSTMIDIRPKDYYEWAVFHKKCEQENLKDYHCIDKADINDPGLLEKVGQYDFVHCTGVVYHLPNPVWGIENLCKIVKKYLVINTVIVPPKIENEYGTLEFNGSQTVFMPGLSLKERHIFNAYYMNKFNMSIDYMAPALDAINPDCPWFVNGKSTCWPYWFLFTQDSFVALVEMMGFEIIDLALWENHTLALFVKKK